MVGGSGEAAVSVFSGRFEGRTAVVTGGASGIGQDMARRLSMWDLNAAALGAAVHDFPMFAPRTDLRKSL